MNEMIERVARQICIGVGGMPDLMTCNYEPAKTRLGLVCAPRPEDIHPMWIWFIPAAREAIEAMREPTEELCNVGDDFARNHKGGAASDIWRTMINAILKDKT